MSPCCTKYKASGTGAHCSGHHEMSKHCKLPSAQMSTMRHCCSCSACLGLEALLPHAGQMHQTLFWSSCWAFMEVLTAWLLAPPRLCTGSKCTEMTHKRT